MSSPMSAEKAATSAALRRLLDILSGGRGVRGSGKARLKNEAVLDSIKSLTRNTKDLDKLTQELIRLSDDFMAKMRGKREALRAASLAEEKALCTAAAKSNSQPPPVSNNRTERQVQRGKAAASELGSKLANKAQS